LILDLMIRSLASASVKSLRGAWSSKFPGATAAVGGFADFLHPLRHQPLLLLSIANLELLDGFPYGLL
jgi:hypothetical protein